MDQDSIIEGLDSIADKLSDAEINPANYDHDDVVALNNAAIDAVALAMQLLDEIGPPIPHIVIAFVDDDTSPWFGNECMYVNGRAWERTNKDTVYSRDIATADDSCGGLIRLEHRFVAAPPNGKWPDNLADLALSRRRRVRWFAPIAEPAPDPLEEVDRRE